MQALRGGASSRALLSGGHSMGREGRRNGRAPLCSLAAMRRRVGDRSRHPPPLCRPTLRHTQKSPPPPRPALRRGTCRRRWVGGSAVCRPSVNGQPRHRGDGRGGVLKLSHAVPQKKKKRHPLASARPRRPSHRGTVVPGWGRGGGGDGGGGGWETCPPSSPTLSPPPSPSTTTPFARDTIPRPPRAATAAEVVARYGCRRRGWVARRAPQLYSTYLLRAGGGGPLK